MVNQMKNEKCFIFVDNNMIETNKLYCARCGITLHPYIYIKNLRHSIILNKEVLLSFCDDCIIKKEKERK